MTSFFVGWCIYENFRSLPPFCRLLPRPGPAPAQEYITLRQRGGMSPRFTKTVSSKVNMRNVGRRKKSGKKKKKLCGTLCGTRGTFVETLYMINCKDFSLERFSKKFKLKLTYWRKWTSSRRKCACCWVVSYFSCDKYDLFCQKQSQVWWFK